jgi:hypothetical protein
MFVVQPRAEIVHLSSQQRWSLVRIITCTKHVSFAVMEEVGANSLIELPLGDAFASSLRQLAVSLLAFIGIICWINHVVIAVA